MEAEIELVEEFEAAVIRKAERIRWVAADSVRTDYIPFVVGERTVVDTAELGDSHSRRVGKKHWAAPLAADSVQWNRRNRSGRVQVP